MPEEVEHGRARLLDELGHRRRRRVLRVRVAEDVAPQQFDVLGQLRLGVEAAAGVVEIDLPPFEAGEVVAAQPLEGRSAAAGA